MSFVVRPWLAARALEHSYPRLLLESTVPAAAVIGIAFGLSWLVHTRLDPGVARLLATSAAYAASAGCAAWAIALKPDERALITQLATKAIGRNRGATE